MRNKVIWLAAAVAGAGFGLVAYVHQPLVVVLSNCTGAISIVPGDPAPTCPPGPYPMVLYPPDPASAPVWMIGGILIAVGLVAFAWSLASLVTKRRRADRSVNLPGS